MRERKGNTGSRLPDFIEPQLATLVESVPPGREWVHELKFDGYRILCRIEHGRPAYLTREAQDWTQRFGALDPSAKQLGVNTALLDGEIVALGPDGVNDFQLLQNWLKHTASARLVYYVFDLLHLNGEDISREPLIRRKKKLRELLKNSGQNGGGFRYSEHWMGEQGEALHEKACASGLEGIISKRKDQPYRSGRTRDWLKIKCFKSQEFVIGGFTDPAGSRSYLGALLIGVYENGRLNYSGKVGTGFNQKSLSDLRARLDGIAASAAPFANPPRGADARGVHWVKPKLVCEINFTGWTSDGLLRHPSFKGLREDKPAEKVIRESPDAAVTDSKPRPARSRRT
jgi:bifunctional non-homologous end joining protein LigD